VNRLPKLVLLSWLAFSVGVIAAVAAGKLLAEHLYRRQVDDED
jgi:hypothetical protein